jgi:peptidoglycan hydrolase CwlO-like protein
MYLQSIVDALPPDYLDVHEPQINDIIMRYNTLNETNQDLLSVVQSNQDEIEKSHQTLQGLIKDKNNLILVYNSKLGAKQKSLDKLKQESAYIEESLEERDNTGKERVYKIN